MPINKEEVEYVAKLACLALTEDEKASFTIQFNEILGFVNKLNELSIQDIAPTTHPIPVSNIFREDIPENTVLSIAEVLQNAPDTEEECFKVPKIFEG